MNTITMVEVLLDETRLLDRLRGGRINTRQTKALLQMFKGPRVLAGGISAGNYSTITNASSATATRDLNLTDQ